VKLRLTDINHRRCTLKIRSLILATFILGSAVLTLNAQTLDARSALERGDVFVAQENYKQAIEEYRKVSSREVESYARATYNIGVCYYELWQTEDAILFYKRAIELKGGNYPRASYALGVALEGQGHLAEAKQAYQQAVSASQRKFAPAIYRLGLLAANAGEYSKAAELFREAASHKGEHVPASRNNLGVMLARLGLLKEAEKEFVSALKESNGRSADAAHNLTLCRSLTSQNLQNRAR
jgi:tetratricopeptide (TPR) repeat protein